MNMKNIIVIIVLAGMFAGCWTFEESVYPETVTTPCGGKDSAATTAATFTIGVNGFAAVLTEIEAVGGYTTVYVPGHHHRHHYEPGYLETVHTVTYLPQRRSTDMFLKRAKDEFEKAGYRLSDGTPDYTVEVEFIGPRVTQEDVSSDILWNLCTLFFCDYAANEWSAKLRVRDNRDGRLVFYHDYTQRYETKVFSLIPILGPEGCSSTTPAAMQSWCLAALTDRVVADVTAYLSKAK